MILFLVAISPFLMQGFSMAPDFSDQMSILFALDIMAIFTILGVMHERYILQNKESLRKRDTRSQNGQKHAIYYSFMVPDVCIFTFSVQVYLLDVVSSNTPFISPPNRSITCKIKGLTTRQQENFKEVMK